MLSYRYVEERTNVLIGQLDLIEAQRGYNRLEENTQALQKRATAYGHSLAKIVMGGNIKEFQQSWLKQRAKKAALEFAPQ